uniref:Methyltransferase domain-containing protein n=1 Tax=Kwoniella dejecticola CBS 10117 TaxID=1296121 RepID=A0A1A6A7E2_9TREE|nr:uncharacterized protein I303_03692 [Kwoniella dejecticola CBS 10117]OBR85977.1 hypothetical protein I303_03692 [Kwoniella dejecticola CBS 10117]
MPPYTTHTPRPADRMNAPSSALPPPLFVNIQERPSPPRQVDMNREKAKMDARPVTPIDFGDAPSDKAMLSRTSTDQRPPVDPAIKGIPQGWEDDMAVSPASTQAANPTVTSQRLGAFKDTRTKLSSFSGTMRSSFRDRGNDKDRDEKRSGGLKLHKGSVRVSQPNSSSLKSTAQDLRPTSPTRKHQASHSVYSDTSFNTEGSIPLVPPSAPTESTDYSTSEFTHLFTPTSLPDHDYPASITSSRSNQSRDRVLGLVNDPSPVPPAGMKTFAKPNIEEVLPFAAGHPFAAWSAPVAEEEQLSASDHHAEVGRRGSMSLSRLDIRGNSHTESSFSLEGWRETPRPRSGLPGKKVWMDSKGEKGVGVYNVGWERDVLDLEARLHETMYEVAGNRHSFADLSNPPEAVLDIGTGAGYWPISMALEYPNTTFVGLDLVPCQTDLTVLADAERRARSTKAGQPPQGMGLWENLEKRVKWQRGNLWELPFDTGVFDLVHIRFVNLGVPETKWYDLLEKATRVLKRGGKLEIVETNYTLPTSSPASLRNSFASMLLADMIQPMPSLAVQFNLPAVESLRASALKPVFHRTWTHNVPGALEDAVLAWVKSASEYKGTGVVKNQSGLQGITGRVRAELSKNGQGMWDFGDDITGSDGELDDRAVNVWAWVAEKR